MLKNNWLSLTAVLLAGLLFVPLGLRWLSLKKQERALADSLARAAAARAKLLELQDREEQVKRQLAGTGVDLSQIIAELNGLGGEVVLVAISPEKPKVAGQLVVLPLTVELEGSYPALLRFLSQLVESTGWVIRHCSLTAESGATKAKLGLWVPTGGDGL